MELGNEEKGRGRFRTAHSCGGLKRWGKRGRQREGNKVALTIAFPNGVWERGEFDHGDGGLPVCCI
jgi:hypothetical protein